MPVHLALLPVFAQSPESDGWQQYEKRSSLRQVLVHVQEINHGRHENDAASDAQKAHQHTNANSQQENDECHGDRAALRVSPRTFRLKPFYLPPSGPASNLLPHAANLEKCPPFFVCTEPAIFECLCHAGFMASRR